MIVIEARNVQEALVEGLTMVAQPDSIYTSKVETRNGTAIEFDYPVTTVYTNPTERVLFFPERDANPFLHLMEPLWMIAGRNDVNFVSTYSRQISAYSTDGVTFNGAYGYRARKHFGYDQFDVAVERLKKYPNDRRTVISFWDGSEDLRVGNEEKDHPCNTAIYLYIRNGRLDMTVTNRSNDMLWGAYGANAVHFSYIQEYLAARIGVQVGRYYQMSNNLHIYTDFGPYQKLVENGQLTIAYKDKMDDYNQFQSAPLVTHPDIFDEELRLWFENPRMMFKNTFLTTTATPAYMAYEAYKKDDLAKALMIAKTIGSLDWRKACVEWIQRRINSRKGK